jgi:hypothetical protein
MSAPSIALMVAERIKVYRIGLGATDVIEISMDAEQAEADNPRGSGAARFRRDLAGHRRSAAAHEAIGCVDSCLDRASVALLHRLGRRDRGSAVMSARNPRVAFGMKAGALALKAKAGRRVTLAEVLALAEAWESLVPDDLAAGVAVARFMARIADHPARAGEGMLAFLGQWWGNPAPRKIPSAAAGAKTGPAARLDAPRRLRVGVSGMGMGIDHRILAGASGTDAALVLTSCALRDLDAVFAARGVQGALLVADLAVEMAHDARIWMATAALAALPEGVMMDVIDALSRQAGYPMPPFEFLAWEARAWAKEASVIECKFYAWAAIQRLAPADRAALIAAMSGGKMAGGGK